MNKETISQPPSNATAVFSPEQLAAITAIATDVARKELSRMLAPNSQQAKPPQYETPEQPARWERRGRRPKL